MPSHIPTAAEIRRDHEDLSARLDATLHALDESRAAMSRLDRDAGDDALTASQQRSWDAMKGQADGLAELRDATTRELADWTEGRSGRAREARSRNGTRFDSDPEGPEPRGAAAWRDPEWATRSPLAFRPEALDGLQAALDDKTAGRFHAYDTEQRAALTTTTFGAPRVWGSSVLNGPRILHVAAGVQRQPSNAVFAQVPNFTLPTAQAGAGENASLAEFAASTAGAVTMARFGRYTDQSRESTIGTSASALVSMHAIGIARDLDTVLINAVETAAGSAVAFTADVPAAIRKAIAQVIDNTAAASAADVVVLTHPDNAALLQDVSPIGGDTMGEGFQRFSGALVYAASATDTGFMTVANLRSGVVYFEAQGTMSETETAVKTGTLTIATSTISGYGLTLNGGATGAFIKVDVVTP